MSGNYGDGVSGRITDGQLNLDFILDERAREMNMELVRRTDLILLWQIHQKDITGTGKVTATVKLVRMWVKM